MNFIPTKTFDSVETRSTYVKGLVYSVKPGTTGVFKQAQSDGSEKNISLAQLVKQWEAEGKVTLNGAQSPSLGA